MRFFLPLPYVTLLQGGFVLIDYVELGGTLFIPASHKDLDAVVNQTKYPQLRSIVIDFEDGLDDRLLLDAEDKFQKVLLDISKTRLFIFVRARDTLHLETLLSFTNISKIDGFVLAKFSLENATDYLRLLEKHDFSFMPSIEGRELFNQIELHTLKNILLTYKENIVLVRYGLEDMLRQLCIGRPKGKSVFDVSALAVTLGNFIATFKSVGFAVSGGVYINFGDNEGFVKDVQRDLQEGLFSKTIIHPNQIALIEEEYKVKMYEYEEAKNILNSRIIVAKGEKMLEPITMQAYAKEILKRADIYGKTDT